MFLTGFHHLTAVTANAPANHHFYTQVLGLRLVKKTVNQDDTSAYHLFYADGLASPGTDITFFDWPVTRERRGTRSIARTGFRVASQASLDYWARRLTELKIPHGEVTSVDGAPTLAFEDPEGQRLAFVVDSDTSPAHPWDRSPVPAEHQVRGLGPITLSIPDLGRTAPVLTGLMNMTKVREYSAPSTDGSAAPAAVHVYQMAPAGGPATELHLAVEPHLAPAHAGAGGVHHVAFRTPSFEEYDQWAERLQQAHVPSSGPVDRYYFRSLYFREPNGILFEIATDGPGFAADEPMERLGEQLALPPFLEPRRQQIEARLKPLHV
jgi:glyoxalase family protein